MTKTKNLHYYDTNASDYHERNKDLALEEFYSLFMEELTGDRILDLGCGTGRDAAYFSQEGLEVVGIDFSSGMLEEASKNAPEAEFHHMSMTDDLEPLGRFNGIWAMASTLHLSKEEMKDLLLSLKESLHEDSPVFISIKEKDIKERIERDFTYWKAREFEETFREAGWEQMHFSKSETEKSIFLNFLLVEA